MGENEEGSTQGLTTSQSGARVVASKGALKEMKSLAEVWKWHCVMKLKKRGAGGRL